MERQLSDVTLVGALGIALVTGFCLAKIDDGDCSNLVVVSVGLGLVVMTVVVGALISTAWEGRP